MDDKNSTNRLDEKESAWLLVNKSIPLVNIKFKEMCIKPLLLYEATKENGF